MAKTSAVNDEPPARKVAVRPPLASVLDGLAEEWATDVTEIVNRFIRESLERRGMWPVRGPGHALSPESVRAIVAQTLKDMALLQEPRA